MGSLRDETPFFGTCFPRGVKQGRKKASDLAGYKIWAISEKNFLD